MISLAARLSGLALIGALALTIPSTATAGDAPDVVLLSAGTGKKAKLRFRPKPGTTQTIQMVSGQQMSMSVGGQRLPAQRLPQTVITMVMKVLSVDKAGRITASFETSKVDVQATEGVPPQLVEQMRGSLQAMTDLKGRMTIDARGRVLSADMSAGKDAPPSVSSLLENMRENMNQLVVPLPEQPVGTGAQWKVAQNLSKMGMPITQEATMTLKSRKGNLITLDNAIVQKVEAGPVQLPNVPPTVTVKTKPSQSNGQGKLQMDLTKVGATGRVDMDINVSMVMQEGGKPPQQMDMSIQMDLAMKDVE